MFNLFKKKVSPDDIVNAAITRVLKADQALRLNQDLEGDLKNIESVLQEMRVKGDLVLSKTQIHNLIHQKKANYAPMSGNSTYDVINHMVHKLLLNIEIEPEKWKFSLERRAYTGDNFFSREGENSFFLIYNNYNDIYLRINVNEWEKINLCRRVKNMYWNTVNRSRAKLAQENMKKISSALK